MPARRADDAVTAAAPAVSPGNEARAARPVAGVVLPGGSVEQAASGHHRWVSLLKTRSPRHGRANSRRGRRGMGPVEQLFLPRRP